VPRITAFRCRTGDAGADHEGVPLFALTLASACALGAVLVRGRAHPGGTTPEVVVPAPAPITDSPWLSLPPAPRAATADDDWVLEAFDADEIAELRRIDDEVRRDLARDHHAAVQALVPDSRRDRRVRAVGWADGRLILVLGDGTALELDGVSRSAAVWLGYCHDQFGLVLDAIGPADTTWALRLESCGVDTPLHASRVRVA
jgi:hypothetical protein